MLRPAAESETRPPIESAHHGASAQLREQLLTNLSAVQDDVVALSRHVHAHPELCFEEVEAAAAVQRLLGAHKHHVTVGAWGLPTSFIARAGSGSPNIAVIAEYDALPGIGHACGHNVICASAVGAFLAVASIIDRLGGSVTLIGAPAEEGGGGKQIIVDAGGFDDVDAALMVHPSGFDVADHPWLGLRQVQVTFTGIAAHAAATPFLGRNALDGVVAAYNGIAQLRQHMAPGDRMHGIITDGGQAMNVVPERASAEFAVRSNRPETLAELSDRMTDVFEAAAGMTGTEVEIVWDTAPAYLPVRSNGPLADRYAFNMLVRGRSVLPRGVVPAELSASTDMGNVSVRVPSIHPLLAIAPATAMIHHPDFAVFAGSDTGDIGAVDGAAGLALTAVDFLADAELRDAVARAFAADGGVLELEAILAGGSGA